MLSSDATITDSGAGPQPGDKDLAAPTRPRDCGSSAGDVAAPDHAACQEFGQWEEVPPVVSRSARLCPTIGRSGAILSTDGRGRPVHRPDAGDDRGAVNTPQKACQPPKSFGHQIRETVQ